jgi:hypothetical protein
MKGFYDQMEIRKEFQKYITENGNLLTPWGLALDLSDILVKVFKMPITNKTNYCPPHLTCRQCPHYDEHWVDENEL